MNLIKKKFKRYNSFVKFGMRISTCSFFSRLVSLKLTRSSYVATIFYSLISKHTCIYIGATRRHHFTSIDRCLIALGRH